MKSIYIDKLNFYWRLKNNFGDKNIVPNFLPFETDYIPDLKLVIQKRNKKTLKYLSKIYKEEPNIGNIQENSNWSNLYGADFLDFIEINLKKNPKIKRILEIGCSSGILLQILKNKGYEVTGIDPSIYASKSGKQKGIKIVRDFFPSKKINGKFDLIFHSDVLEHVNDPVNFLKKHLNFLNDAGAIIISTPNCTDCILNGDISCFFHQHLNYFDTDSLEICVNTAGFEIISIKKAEFGGSLYCVAEKSYISKKLSATTKNFHQNKYKQFIRKYSLLNSKLTKLIKEILKDKKKSLGFYAPVRAFPYLAILKSYFGFRLFDDTSSWHQKYFDGINIPIENFYDLRKNPVTDLFIMSPTFGDIIERKIIKYFGKKVRIKKLTDFYRDFN